MEPEPLYGPEFQIYFIYSSIFNLARGYLVKRLNVTDEISNITCYGYCIGAVQSVAIKKLEKIGIIVC